MVAQIALDHPAGDVLDAPGPDVLAARAKWAFDGSERPSWAEPPGPHQQSVWDFPRPPRIEAEARRVRVVHAEVVVAESRSALRVLETAGAPTLYVPEADVDATFLLASQTPSFCEWKGRAQQFHVRTPGGMAEDAAWSYPEPYPEFDRIRGWLAFHPGRLDACWLDEAKVAPQPGGYYGGWVTPDLAGPIKGGPGSGSW